MDALRFDDGSLRTILVHWGAPVSMQPGRAVFLQGDPADYCFYLTAGRISPIRYRSDDYRIVLEDIGPGSICGLSECYLGTTYRFDALAVERCGALRFSQGSLKRLFASPATAEFLFRSLAQENTGLHNHLDLAGVGNRIAAFLLSRAEGTGKTRIVRTTQERIAAAVGAARETVNRRLQDLERAGVLETGRGEVLVYRLDELARMVGGM